MGGAPVITAIEQVVPVATLQKIGRWRARLKACLKAAARGSYALAKKLRPPDLELVSAEHTVEGARGWVWDLRPLARGEAAVPVAESSLLAPPLTDLKLGCVAALGEEYADQEIISEMLAGFSLSRTTRWEWRATSCCRRHTWVRLSMRGRRVRRWPAT